MITRQFITDNYQAIIIKYSSLKNHQIRLDLGQLAASLGRGGISFISALFGVSRNYVRKGRNEFLTGHLIIDQYHRCGRKKAVVIIPTLEGDIRDLIDHLSQTDPTFKTTRLFARLTIKQIRKHLITMKNYVAGTIPSISTIRRTVLSLGYILKKGQKTKPIKKIEETDAIFENISMVREFAKTNEDVVYLSMDAKDRIKIGAFYRTGMNYLPIQFYDHDFSQEFLTPFGIYDIKTGKIALSCTTSKVTADFMIDQLENLWESVYKCLGKKKLIIHLDNGPENSSRRTQFMKRIVEMSLKYDIHIHLVYYPPYHSKYNPVERVWGALEQHFNGNILDSIETVIKFCESLEYKGNHPEVLLNEEVYETGKKVSIEEMKRIELGLERKKGIEKWDVQINPFHLRITGVSDMLNLEIMN